MPPSYIVNQNQRIFFTAPWEPVIVRRGDAIGLRALADQFADSIAPDLSNRIRDGRWVTILAWCLARSHEVYHASGGRSVATRTQQRERYAWLRPLELMWVARTISLAEEDWKARSLAGQRRVKPWYENNKSTDRFGMSVDQFRAYRQTGMYGGYRLVFRKWPRMTVQGDGWTPGPATNLLAKWLDERLKAAQPPWPLSLGDDHENSPLRQKPKLGQGDQYDWWLRQWKTFDHGSKDADKNTLPRRKDDFEKLPEADELEPIVFGVDSKGQKRRKVAHAVAKAAASDHMEVCEHLSRVFANDSVIALLPRFTQLADAGMVAMDVIAAALGSQSSIKLADVAKLDSAKKACSALMTAAKEWRRYAGVQLSHIDKAHRFVSAIKSAQPSQCLKMLLQHHETYGGGLRWFVLRNGLIEPRTLPHAGTSRYRFRLWSLCRLATQCGVLRKMPRAISDDVEAKEYEAEEASDE